jgi:hypothetical protein
MNNILKAIEFTDTVSLAKEIGLSVEEHEDEEITIDCKFQPDESRVLASDEIDSYLLNTVGKNLQTPIVIIGRTCTPPFCEISEKSSDLLQSQRCLKVMNVVDLLFLIHLSLSKGWCVDNDWYFFSEHGGLLGYVSHHDEVLVDIYPCPGGLKR